MTKIREAIWLEAPYVLAVGAFERRLGLNPRADEGSCGITLVAPLAPGREIARVVTATTTRLPGAANYTSRYGVVWSAGRSERGLPTPGFEGTVTLSAGEDYDESELVLEGRYSPPGGFGGEMFDQIAGSRIAHATLASLLDGLRDEIVTDRQRVEAAKIHH